MSQPGKTPGEENAFRQLRLNQWVKQSIRWMPMDKWDACPFPVLEEDLEGRVCYGGLGWFLGGCDGLIYTLIIFVVIDYITGVMCAIADHRLSLEIGFKGICRKVLLF